MLRGNRGEWGEPYAAIRILGEGRLFIADADGHKNPDEWMSILELIRHEAQERIVTYRYQENNVDIDIIINGELFVSVPATEFLRMADMLSREIRDSRTRVFEVSDRLNFFFERIGMLSIKAKSIDKSDVFLSVRDPRAGIVREHIGFSIKSEFGQNPTLFNTSKASAFIYKLSNMNDALMEEVNSMIDDRGHTAVSDRCDRLIECGCNPTFVDLPIAARAGCRAFKENLDLIDPRLITVIERLLYHHFFDHDTDVDLDVLIDKLIVENPCNLSRPDAKYPYMFKSFLYAAYCGMTAGTLWNGNSQVNGGFIKVSQDGEVLAHYALESDAFKTYLFNNCYLEFPATDEGHGNYAKVYKEGNEYYFRLNFQIRYR